MTSIFGIPFYSPLSDLTVLTALSDAKYFVTPPSPHPLFKQYIVQATNDLGVVWIKGLSEPEQTDAYGLSIQSLVDRLANQLEYKYGIGVKTDLLLNGAMWDEPQYWMHALNDGQRYYSYKWNRTSNGRIPEEIEIIYLGASAYSHTLSACVIEYKSSKQSLAAAEIERDLADLL